MAVLFDLDGVFYQAGEAIAGAAEVARWVAAENIPHLFLTNTSSKPRRALVKKLAGFDIETSEDHILTPAVAAVRWLSTQLKHRPVALFVPDITRTEFSSLPIWIPGNDTPGAVVIGDLGKAWDFDTLNQAFRLLMNVPKPQLIALGMTRYWMTDEGLQLDVAPFVMALSHAAEVEPVVLGKPADAFFKAALDILDSKTEKTVMIGDDIRGDIEGAQKAGLHAVLVRTGKYQNSDLELGIKPDAVLDSIIDFPDWYETFM
jgi:HAD superfamily hydrolase (TIGR01458 family)